MTYRYAELEQACSAAAPRLSIRRIQGDVLRNALFARGVARQSSSQRTARPATSAESARKRLRMPVRSKGLA